jgi:hypothetical protein
MVTDVIEVPLTVPGIAGKESYGVAGWEALDVIGAVEAVIQEAMLGRELAEEQMEESETDPDLSLEKENC